MQETFHCRCVISTKRINSALNLPSLMRTPSLASKPESVNLSTAKSDNCDCKGNNHKEKGLVRSFYDAFLLQSLVYTLSGKFHGNSLN